jgi:hypothetical protein
MKKIVPNSASCNVGIWIDHRRALIVSLTPNGESSTSITSKVEKHLERGGDSPMKGSYEARQVPSDRSRLRAFTGEINGYYDAVIVALPKHGEVLLFGPGEAKGELHARLSRMNLADRVASVQTEGQMTDRQIVAKVRAHFGVEALRVQTVS